MLTGNGKTLYGHRWEREKTLPRELDPAVVSAYRVTCDTLNDTRDNAHTHYWWTLCFIMSDDIRFRIGSWGNPWTVHPRNCVYLVAPHTDLWRDSRRTKATATYCYISVYGGEKLGFSGFVPPGKSFARFDDTAGRLQGTLMDLVQLGEKEGYPAFCKAQALLFSLCDLLYRAVPTDLGVYHIGMPTDPVKGTDFARRVQTVLGRDITLRMTLSQIAKELHVSVSVLTHRYREEAGESPMKTLIRMRLERARELIRNGEPLKNIIEATGFCDIFHLSRTFKHFEHMTPTDYAHRFRPSGVN